MRKIYYKTQEMCPYCDYVNNLRFKGKMISKCKMCKKELILCAQCENMDCRNCIYDKKEKKIWKGN